MSQDLKISEHKQRFHQHRFFAMGLVLVFLLAAAGLCLAAGTPGLPAATLPAQAAANPTNTLLGTAGDATRHEWVFVDTSVAGYRDLVDDLAAGGSNGRRIEVVLIDSRRDGVAQIAAALVGYSNIDAIHLITHGSRAELQLGSAWLTRDSMIGAYADALSKIGQALTEGGDILVYGCNFGQGALGGIEERPESIRDSRQKAQDQTSRYFALSEAHLGIALLKRSPLGQSGPRAERQRSAPLTEAKLPGEAVLKAEGRSLSVSAPQAHKLDNGESSYENPPLF